MFSHIRSATALSVVVTSLCFFAAVVQAGDQKAASPDAPSAKEPATIALAKMDSATISWQPMIAYSSVVLTITGPGDLMLEREFPKGALIAVNVADGENAPLGDGQYNFELRFAPDLGQETRAALAAARKSGDMSIVENLKAAGKLPRSPLVDSGNFQVVGGSIVSDSDAAEEFAKDIIHADDVIAQFSMCIGSDCVNGESFGFDTLRLKENNLQIHFDDTSASASFPLNDWRIKANDSSNGGASYLAFEDSTAGRQVFRVEAGARANALYVDSGGDVGIGTSAPVVDLHTKTGNTPTLRLEQDGTSGFTAQTWDVAGNEAGFFVRDATNSSALSFRIQPGSANESLYIKSTGVEVNAAFSAVSDVNMKTDLVAVDAEHALERVAEMPVNTWSFTHDPSGSTHLGPTAQDFHQAFELGADDRHIAPLDAAGVALAAIQGLNSRLEATDDALQQSGENLQSENARLAARLAEVEEQNQELAERLANLERALEAKSGDR